MPCLNEGEDTHPLGLIRTPMENQEKPMENTIGKDTKKTEMFLGYLG
jgi:hypothetical protein